MASNQIALLAVSPGEIDPTIPAGRAAKLQDLAVAQQQQQQAVADDANARASLRADPTGGSGFLQGLAGAGNVKGFLAGQKANLDASKTRAEIGKDQATADKTATEDLNLRTARYRDALNTVNDKASAAQWVQALYADPHVGPQIAKELGPVDQAVARIPDPTQDPQGFAAWKRGSQLGADKLVEVTKPVVGSRTLGNRVENTITDPTTGAVQVTGTAQIGQSPDNAATNARVAAEGKANRANQITVQTMIGDRQDSSGVEPNISDETSQRLARQAVGGDYSGLKNMGRGAQGAANLVKIQNDMTAEAKRQGLSPEDLSARLADFEGLKAGIRTSANISARVENAAAEAKQLAPLALAASAEVSRSGFLPFGKLETMFDNQTNDPAMNRFATANQGMATAYASAMARGNKPTVSDNEHARALLATAKSQQAYEAVIGQMQQEIEAATAAPQHVRSNLGNQISHRAAPGAPAGGGNPAPTNAKGWTLHQDANGNKAYVSPDGRQFEEVH